MRFFASAVRSLRNALIPILVFGALLAWGLSSPMGSSPDEDYHLASIWCGDGIRPGLCEAGNHADQRRVPAPLLYASSCFEGKSEQAANCGLPPDTKLVNTARGNFNDHGYPPVYYAVMGLLASPHLFASLLLIRAANAALFTALASVLFFLLRRGERGALAWGTLAAIVPLGLFLVPSANPSSWAVTSAATLWIAMVGYYRAQTRTAAIGFGVVAAVATVVGAGARADSAIYGVLAMAIAALLTFDRSRGFLIRSWLPVLLAIVSYLLYRTAGQSSALSVSGPKLSPSRFFALLVNNLDGLPTLWTGTLGSWSLGWFDTPIPYAVWVPVAGCFAALGFWGLRRASWRRLVALGVMLLALIGVPMYLLMVGGIPVGTYIQPRYIYPLMIMAIGMALWGSGRDDLGLSRAQRWLVISVLSIAMAISLHVNMRRYITGVDIVGLNLNKHAEWWWQVPVAPMWVWGLGAAAFTGALVGLNHVLVGRAAVKSAHGPAGVPVSERVA